VGGLRFAIVFGVLLYSVFERSGYRFA